MGISLVINILITTLAIMVFTILIGMMFTSTLETIFCPMPKIANLGDVLLLPAIINHNILLGKGGSCSQVIKINGVDSGAKSNSELQSLILSKQRWLDHLAERGADYKIITLRREYKHNITSGEVSPILKNIHDKWMENFKKTYTNTHYVMLTVHSNKKEGISSFIKKGLPAANTGLLKELSTLTVDMLSEFKPEIVDNTGEWSELMSFLRELVTAKKENMRSQKKDIGDAISDRITFIKNDEIIQYNHKLFVKIISLNKWSDSASPEMLKEILSLPGRIEVLQLFKGYGKIKALLKLKYQRKQKQILFKNAHIDDEYRVAIEEIEAGKTTFYDYQLSVLVFGEDIDSLQRLETDVKRIFMSYGLTPVVEEKAKEKIWRTRFPGDNTLVRPTNPMSCNLSYLINFESEPVGLDSCDWGEGPIRPFKTASGGAYSLQLHISDRKEASAHALVVAPTEGGKTTLFQHLIGGALRHSQLRAFIFDRLNGTRIFTEAIGGSYIDFTEGKVPLNPLVCKEVHSNEAFLKDFLLMLAKCDRDDSENNKEASTMVEQLLKVPIQERILKKCFSQVASKGSHFANGLRRWAFDGTLSGWFNGTAVNIDGKEVAFDALDLSASRVTAFEMTPIQSNPETAAAVTTYIMYRIRAMGKEGYPHLVFIDETAPMLEDPIFSKSVDTLLNEHRKLRGAVAVCFQNPDKITSVIQNACKTKFLFVNPNAVKEHYKDFNLTSFEWEYIKGVSRISKHLKRSVLVKRADERSNESVILNIDLSPLGNLLQLYRSGSEPINIIRELKEQWGVNQWVERYLNL